MITHRIVTDGIQLKVQALRVRRPLWWRRERWEDVGQGQGRTWSASVCKTHLEAYAVWEKLTRIEAARHPWTPVFGPPTQ